jgi:hypothetical protein
LGTARYADRSAFFYKFEASVELGFWGGLQMGAVWTIHSHGHLFFSLDAVPNDELGQISLTVMQNIPAVASLSRVKLKFGCPKLGSLCGCTR